MEITIYYVNTNQKNINGYTGRQSRLRRRILLQNKGSFIMLEC